MSELRFDQDGYYIPKSNVAPIRPEPIEVSAPFAPVMWQELWDDPGEDAWILEPLIPEGGQVVIYSAPKVGKSLLMLEVAAGLAAGNRDVLGVHVAQPRSVVYFDHENRLRGDVRTRLQAMGYTPNTLTNLHLYSFPAMAKLDTAIGGLQCLEIAKRHNADLVIIDTVSRTITGEENSNDTWLQFYINTGALLKAARIAMVRLDHEGKDADRGQRGGSAKSGDVDLVWHLKAVTDDVFTLKCEAKRVELEEELLTIKRHKEPLRHTVDAMGIYGALEAKQAALLALLDKTAAPKDIGAVEATQWLRDHGHTCANGAVTKRMLESRRLGTA